MWGGGGKTVLPGPTFDQGFVAKDLDTLIDQSLTLIKKRVYFFLQLHNFICNNTEISLIRAIFTWGPLS